MKKTKPITGTLLTWKTLQCEGKNHGHQPATTFTIFMECLQERRDLFRWLTRGLYSKTLIRTAGAPPLHPRASLWPKPPNDSPSLRSPTWPPSRNLDHNSTLPLHCEPPQFAVYVSLPVLAFYLYCGLYHAFVHSLTFTLGVFRMLFELELVSD
jgi:hypothetical protein